MRKRRKGYDRGGEDGSKGSTDVSIRTLDKYGGDDLETKFLSASRYNMKPRKKLKVSHGTASKEQKGTREEDETKRSKKKVVFDDVGGFSETENLDEVIADDEEEDQEGATSSYLLFLNVTQMNLLLKKAMIPRKANKMTFKTSN
jgi:hypothetical protein